MTIADYRAAQAALTAYFEAPAFVLLANSVYSNYERASAIALFDTREQAVAYEAAVRLPVAREEGGYLRAYREGSLLYNYSPHAGEYGDMVQPALPWFNYVVPFNPAVSPPVTCDTPDELVEQAAGQTQPPGVISSDKVLRFVEAAEHYAGRPRR